MGPYLGAIVDFVHALALLAWVGGLPILFLARSERLRRAYAVYAIGFIVLSWTSRWLLGACFLTRISTALWKSGRPHLEAAPETWFTVRFAEAVFHLRPREESIVAIWYGLVLVSCLGLLVHARRARRGAGRGPVPGGKQSQPREASDEQGGEPRAALPH